MFSALFKTNLMREKLLISLLALLLIASATEVKPVTGGLFPQEYNSRKQLISVFSASGIKVDGIAENEWSKAVSSAISVAMTSNLSGPAGECVTRGVVSSLWDGAVLYLLFEITDADVTAEGKRPNDQDGVEIFLDLYNDKFPKNEEDDAIIRINCKGELSGSGLYTERLVSYAAAPVNNSNSTLKGYIVEAAIATGGITAKNGTRIGFDFGINDADTPSNRCRYRIFWNSGSNRGLDDNSMWGEVLLSGYDGKTRIATDKYLLSTNIKKAEALQRGIWTDEKDLDRALLRAKKALLTEKQKKADAGNKALSEAMQALRRKGKYPDPYDLAELGHLPDPFTFRDGRKVRTEAEWTARREEIKDLVQYYEYGYMPEAPEGVTARLNGTTLSVTVLDNGKSASFDAKLTIPSVEQCGRSGPYPVIVSIDFWAAAAPAIYLDAGYAVLSITYSSIASDNFEHTGAFYTLYPYEVTAGKDVGTLMAWAWGASRSVDALIYLAENNSTYKNTFDYGKLAVTGFSRCGKAALVAGLMDERFGVVNPGASGCGGAAVYRYESFGNTPFRSAPFGNVYDWGTSTGCEVLGDRIRHQGHNSNEMLQRFLDHGRIYKTMHPGYGQRLPYDHHEILAAIAPRALLITTADDDYANGAEGDCISMEGARPVFRFLGADQNLALNIRRTDKSAPVNRGGGHRLDNDQIKNFTEFCNMVFYGKRPDPKLAAGFYSNPYLPALDVYYGGLRKMMPWLDSIPGNK